MNGFYDITLLQETYQRVLQYSRAHHLDPLATMDLMTSGEHIKLEWSHVSHE